MKQISVYASGATTRDHQIFRVRANAAAVAILEGVRQRTVAEYHDDENVISMLISAAALGLESLKEPCEVRVFTKSPLLRDCMTGRMKRAGYFQAWRRLERAAARHKVEWIAAAGPYELTVLDIAYDAAHRVANLALIDGSIIITTTARAGAAREKLNRPAHGSPSSTAAAAGTSKLVSALLEEKPSGSGRFGWLRKLTGGRL